MRKALLAFLALVALLVFVQASTAVAFARDQGPRLPASAWYLVGPDGEVLAAHRARERRAIASITKLMTAVVAIEHARLSETVVVDRRVAAVGESTAHLRPGEKLAVADLVRATLVPSGNDGALALAYYVGGGSIARFVELMNAKASELGLADTTFRNPHGLDEPGHLSSARDATVLLRYALGIPFLRDALGRELVELPGGRVVPTTDDLLASWPRFLGGKTGHTGDAGWSQAGAAAARGATVYGTTLGSATRAHRNEALRALLEYGLDRYRRIAAIVSGRRYAEVETGYGRPAVALVALRAEHRTVRDDVALLERVVAPSSVTLPVRAGQRLGTVEVWRGDALLASAPLVAAETVTEPGVVGKVFWYVRTTFGNVWELVS
ncbi:MAG: D-alanyl-D-alanine carboxypeptidase [Gaiellaceae bacterium]|jgi:D-alanyl-D-alanine carboxypeptidase (penicillin-binding protein 5/6)|nr:MAG: D-alanyl-D-alanine carboxypeptidase [Gaiellaceae bacterium]